jgi:hypothetical protein
MKNKMNRQERKENYRIIVTAVPLGNGDLGLTYESVSPRGMEVHDTFGIGESYIRLVKNATQIAIDAMKKSDFAETVYVGAEIYK